MAETQKPGASAPPSSSGKTDQERKADEAALGEAKLAAEAKAAEEAAAKQAPPDREPEPAFAIEDLLDHARTATGFSRHMLAGALYGYEGETITVSEAKDLAEAFSEKPVEEAA